MTQTYNEKATRDLLNLDYRKTPTFTLIAQISGCVARGANINATDANDNNNTPLHKAAAWGRARIVLSLYKWGAEVDVTNSNNETPILLATRHYHMTTVRALRDECHANTMIWDTNGDTIMHYLANSGHNKEIIEFHKLGMPLNMPNFMGKQPVHMAVDHPDTIVTLGRLGADISALTKDGQTVFDLMREKYSNFRMKRFEVDDIEAHIKNGVRRDGPVKNITSKKTSYSPTNGGWSYE